MELGKKSYELQTNHAFQDWPMQNDPILPEVITDEEGKRKVLDTGMKILENGDISFKIYAPGVQTLHVTTGRELNQKDIDLVKDAEGFFTGVIPFDPMLLGPHSMDFIVDGTCFLYPYSPISWHRDRPVNYIDLPDPETPYCLMKDVPHGAIIREMYWSETMGRYQRCVVYTPAGYMKNTEEYPVLYLQHGATENEITWEYNGRVSEIMDNLIAEGKAEPMIIVMNDGMVRMPDGKTSALAPMLLNDCIPYIEKTYRVKTDKWSRAMAGLSMGSMQTSQTGLTHPEVFGYLGIFSGFLGAFRGNQDHLEALKDPAKMAEDYRVFFRCIGDIDLHFPTFENEDPLCDGIKDLPFYHRAVYPGQQHEFGAWRRALYDFAQMIFK